MSTLNLNAPDFTAPDLNGDQLPDDDFELVHWYRRPDWRFGAVSPKLALAGAFALGLVIGAGAFGVGALIRDQLED